MAVGQDSLNIGQQHQLVGVQSGSHRAGDVVGVDIVGLALLADPDRRHNRDVALVPDRLDNSRVDPGDLPDEAQVNRLLVRPGAR